MTTIAIIPAKGNSTGVPGKNTARLGDYSLVERAILSADVPLIDRVYVSTDCDEVINQVISLGDVSSSRLRILDRPQPLTIDSVQVDEVALYCFRQIEWLTGEMPDTVVILQPTSPFRTSTHVSEALELFNKTRDSSGGYLFSAVSAGYYYAAFDWSPGPAIGHDPEKRVGRQQIDDSGTGVIENGAIYIVDGNMFSTNRSFRNYKMMPYAMDSISSLEIDSPKDFAIAEACISMGLAK